MADDTLKLLLREVLAIAMIEWREVPEMPEPSPHPGLDMRESWLVTRNLNLVLKVLIAYAGGTPEGQGKIAAAKALRDAVEALIAPYPDDPSLWPENLSMPLRKGVLALEKAKEAGL